MAPSRALAAVLSALLVLSGVAPRAAAAAAPEDADDLNRRLSELGLPVRESDPARQELLDRRSRMLQTHQNLGLIAAVPLTLNLFVSPGERETENGVTQQSGSPDLHAALGMTGAALYFASAYYAYRAPTVPGSTRSGTTRVHRWLSFVHFPAMIATAALGGLAYSQRKKGQSAHGIAEAHSAFATAGTGVFLTSLVVMKFDLGSRVGEEKVR